jgi:hypothetical protein
MLLQEYRKFINDLIEATRGNKLHWTRGTSPSSFSATPNTKRRILLDAYNAQVENNTNSCINMALFDEPSNKLLDELVICDQADQMEDYNLIKDFYQLVKKQYADKEINPILTEITASIR